MGQEVEGKQGGRCCRGKGKWPGAGSRATWCVAPSEAACGGDWAWQSGRQASSLLQPFTFACAPPALNLPASVEDVCPNIPSLEKLMGEIVEVAESGIRYTQMPHVMEVVLPLLCSYLSRWWEHGPESNPARAATCCTALSSEHMNTLLGNILKIIYNNLGIDEGAWMKRLAGEGRRASRRRRRLFQRALTRGRLDSLCLSLY